MHIETSVGAPVLMESLEQRLVLAAAVAPFFGDISGTWKLSLSGTVEGSLRLAPSPRATFTISLQEFDLNGNDIRATIGGVSFAPGKHGKLEFFGSLESNTAKRRTYVFEDSQLIGYDYNFTAISWLSVTVDKASPNKLKVAATVWPPLGKAGWAKVVGTSTRISRGVGEAPSPHETVPPPGEPNPSIGKKPVKINPARGPRVSGTFAGSYIQPGKKPIAGAIRVNGVTRDPYLWSMQVWGLPASSGYKLYGDFGITPINATYRYQRFVGMDGYEWGDMQIVVTAIMFKRDGILQGTVFWGRDSFHGSIAKFSMKPVA